jgi:hypothetical protein
MPPIMPVPIPRMAHAKFSSSIEDAIPLLILQEGFLNLLSLQNLECPTARHSVRPGLHLVSRGRVSFALIGLLPFHG